MILYRQQLKINGYGLCNMDGDFNGNNQDDMRKNKLHENNKTQKSF